MRQVIPMVKAIAISIQEEGNDKILKVLRASVNECPKVNAVTNTKSFFHSAGLNNKLKQKSNKYVDIYNWQKSSNQLFNLIIKTLEQQRR